MLRIDREGKSLVPLDRMTMQEAGFWERRDIQEMICRTPDSFCDELGEYIHFVGSEVHPTEFVQDRIDLLGVDPEGVAVVVEIKRSSHKLHLLQALSYAGMIAEWTPERFIDELFRFNGHTQATADEARAQLEEILEEGDLETINRTQRIVLLAEAFDYEVLVTAEWLTERYNVDIRCYRLALAKNGTEEFMTCTRAYPPPELTDIAVRRRRKREFGAEPSGDWEEVLRSLGNEPVAKFVRTELDAKRENRAAHKTLTYRKGDKRRFRMWIKRKFAYVRQYGRFDGDVAFWQSRLNAKADIKPTQEGKFLRFRLWTELDFQSFKSAWNGELQTRDFESMPEEENDAPDAEE
jgi:hypothetical protein